MRFVRSLAVAASTLLAGCLGDPGTAGTGKVTVLLKDAPAPEITRAVVTITQIGLQGPGGLTVLSTASTTTDLLTLANDVETLVDGAEIPAGTYSQLRFVISGAFLEAGGVVYASSPDYEGLPPGTEVGGSLQMPSYDRSGLKVILPGDGLVVGPGATTLIVDFDVSRSFGHPAGQSGMWVMHPVVKATDLEETGALAVTLTPGETVVFPPGVTLASFTAVVAPAGGGDGVMVPLTETAGVFGATFVNLFAGDYTVTFLAPAGLTWTTDPPVPSTATVLAAQVTSADFTLTAIAAGGL